MVISRVRIQYKHTKYYLYSKNLSFYVLVLGLLSVLANGRLVLCLEGGSNVDTVSHSMAMCVKALLGDALPRLENMKSPSASCVETVQKVLHVQAKYWTSLEVLF